MRRNLKKIITIVLDVVLGIYLVFAFTAFNKPDETANVCTKVSIDIADEAQNGFINVAEIRDRLEKHKLYPLEKPLKYVDARKIEDMLKTSPFVNTAECYKTQNGHVNISITQRMPIVRIKSVNGDDYYLDDKHAQLQLHERPYHRDWLHQQMVCHALCVGAEQGIDEQRTLEKPNRTNTCPTRSRHRVGPQGGRPHHLFGSVAHKQ